jgi:NAD-reducing hydrogenase large subunit
MLSLVRADGAMDLYDGVLRARDASGKIILDGASDQSYLELIEEEVRPWSYMKFPHLKSIGRDTGWYRVGPLARVQNCDFIPSPLAEAQRREFVDWGRGQPVHATLAYHWARMIEVLHTVEVIRDLLADPDILAGDLMADGVRRGEGVGVIEAPRGTLIHHYRVGADDLVTMCNLIVSTTHNNQAMNEAVRSVAREYLDGNELTEGLLNRIEVAIRAYDPCLSCATHALGQMPLDVTLIGPGGESIDHVFKSSNGEMLRSLAAPVGLPA